MSQFASYQPTEHGIPAEGLQLRAAALADAAEIAAIWAARHGASVAEAQPGVERHLQAIADGRAPDHVCVALLCGALVGFGRCGHRLFSGTGAADGWYLTGLKVRAAQRRQGVGRALAQHRLGWLAGQGAEAVYSFTNAANHASLALHRSLGFVEVSRDFTIPGAVSVAGESVLLRRSL